MLIHNAEVTGSLNINNVPFNSGSFSGSFQGDGSQLTGITGATTASYVEYSNVGNKPALVSSSAQIVGYGIFATTGSNSFNGSQAITGSLTVTGQVVAQTLNVQQVTSSIVFSSGSNIFGNSLSNTQQFTGSVSVTGSLTVVTAGIELQVTSTGVNIGNALTDVHTITGSLGINGQGTFYQPLTNSTSYLTVQNNRARNAAVQTTTTNGSFIAGTSIGTDTFNYQIYDGVAGSARLTISSTGAATFSNIVNVGYDSNNRSTIRLTSNAANRQAAIYFYGNNAESSVLGYEGGSEIVSGGVQGDFVIRNVLANKNIILATNNGNIGIGTISPNATLDVQTSSGVGSSTASGLARFITAGTTTGISVGQANSARRLDISSYNIATTGEGLYLGTLSNHPIYFSTNSVDRMSIGSTANQFDLMIGVSSPLQPAANRGSVSINGSSSSILSFGVGSATKAYLYTGGTTLTIESVGASAGMVFATGNADRMSITSDGYLRMASGTGGIQFNGDTAAANALDDYEEGTWTASIRGAGTAGTYEIVTNICSYTKIGRQVTASAFINLASSVTGGGTGYAQIQGLPFAKGNNIFCNGTIAVSGIDFTGIYLTCEFISVSSNSTLYISEVVDGSGSVDLPVSAIGADDLIRFTITYFT